MSSLTARRRAYVAVQVTLTGGVDHLIDLVNTILAAETGMPTPAMVCPDACGHLILQNDPGNTTAHVIEIGDGLALNSGTKRYGYQLAVGATQSYTSGNLNVIQFGSMYGIGANGDKLNIEVMTY